MVIKDLGRMGSGKFSSVVCCGRKRCNGILLKDLRISKNSTVRLSGLNTN